MSHAAYLLAHGDRHHGESRADGTRVRNILGRGSLGGNRGQACVSFELVAATEGMESWMEAARGRFVFH